MEVVLGVILHVRGVAGSTCTYAYALLFFRHGSETPMASAAPVPSLAAAPEGGTSAHSHHLAGFKCSRPPWSTQPTPQWRAAGRQSFYRWVQAPRQGGLKLSKRSLVPSLLRPPPPTKHYPLSPTIPSLPTSPPPRLRTTHNPA